MPAASSYIFVTSFDGKSGGLSPPSHTVPEKHRQRDGGEGSKTGSAAKMRCGAWPGGGLWPSGPPHPCRCARRSRLFRGLFHLDAVIAPDDGGHNLYHILHVQLLKAQAVADLFQREGGGVDGEGLVFPAGSGSGSGCGGMACSSVRTGDGGASSGKRPARSVRAAVTRASSSGKNNRVFFIMFPSFTLKEGKRGEQVTPGRKKRAGCLPRPRSTVSALRRQAPAF